MKWRLLSFLLILGVGLLLSALTLAVVWDDSAAQGNPTATTGIFAEALNPNANVRREPTIEAERLGVIQPGTLYPVHGKRFEWLLIEYSESPNGFAWVHQSVVVVTGDLSLIPEVDPLNLPIGQPIPSASPAVNPTHPVSQPVTTQPSSLTPPTAGRLPTFTPPAATPTPPDFSALEAGVLVDPDAELARRLAALEAVYVEQPLILFYAGHLILLDPAMVGFQLDTEAMRPVLRENLEGEFRIVETPIIASYSDELLTAYLVDLASRYETPASLGFDNVQLVFRHGRPGLALDIETARQQIAAAFYRANQLGRVVDLPLLANLEPPADMATLQQAILNYFATRGIQHSGPDSVISVYVRDLATGVDMGIQSHVLHSAVSTAKIGVMAGYFRSIFQEPSDDMKFRLAAAVLCSSNADANLLIDTIGNQNALEGLRRTTETFCQAGAVNTVVNRHFFIGAAGENGIPTNYYVSATTTPCPGSENAPLDTSASTLVDPWIQTTAADMGQMLSMIYDCAHDGSGLGQVFPGEITQTECRWMLELLRGTRFMHLTELGIPEGIPFAHKVGYGGEALGDAGIVFSPGGDYIIVIYAWDRRLDELDTYALSRWNITAEISRIVYNYFNLDAPHIGQRLPPNPFGGVACVLPNNPAAIDLNHINNGRFDVNGAPLPSACYDWPTCRQFTGWGQ